MKCFEYRLNWKISSDKNDKINFIWAPLSTQVDFYQLNSESHNIKKMCNHFPKQAKLSNKYNCFESLMGYCEEKNIDIFIFKYVPLAKLIQYESPLFLRQIKAFEYIFNNIDSFIFANSNLKDWKKKY